MNVKEASAMLGISESNFRRILRSGSSEFGTFLMNEKRATYIVNASKVLEWAGKVEKCNE